MKKKRFSNLVLFCLFSSNSIEPTWLSHSTHRAQWPLELRKWNKIYENLGSLCGRAAGRCDVACYTAGAKFEFLTVNDFFRLTAAFDVNDCDLFRLTAAFDVNDCVFFRLTAAFDVNNCDYFRLTAAFDVNDCGFFSFNCGFWRHPAGSEVTISGAFRLFNYKKVPKGKQRPTDSLPRTKVQPYEFQEMFFIECSFVFPSKFYG